MIVDDEILVRVGLKSTIDWESLGFTVVAEASNGEQALEYYKTHKPDVVLTDIRMPKKDGLQLTEIIKKENPKVKILILTCYDDFSYAREALKLGASDYILKSEIEDEELEKIMQDIRHSLDMESEKQEEYFYLKNQITSNMAALKDKMLDDLIKSNIKIDEDFYLKCREMDFDIKDKKLMLAALYREDAEKFGSISDKDLQLMNFAIANITSEILNENGLTFLMSKNDNNLFLLICGDQISDSGIVPVFSKIKNSVGQYLDIPLSIVYSRRFDDIMQTGKAFEDCEKSSQLIFYSGESSVFKTLDKEFKDINIIEIKKRYEQVLLNCLDEEKLDKAFEVIDELEMFFKNNLVFPLKVRIFYSNLMTNALEYYNSYFSNYDELREYTDNYNLIMKAARLKDVTSLIKEFVINLVKHIEEYRLNNSNRIINKAIDFINKNYGQDISLQSLASHLNLSKHYVCYLFKKETGENISSYINKVRIEKAKHLILESNCKIKEVYDKLGFSDQQYFCKIFKKITGMTVVQYRDSILKKKNTG